MTAMTFDRTVPRPAPPRPALRFTPRGRTVLILVLLAVALVAFSLGRTSASATRDRVAPRETVVVQPGESLWQIARRVAPGADPRVYVARLVSVNDLGSAPVQPGQRLELPR